MKNKYIIALILCAAIKSNANQVNETIDDFGLNARNSEKKIVSKSGDNQVLYSKIESLEEAIKNLNNRVEELTRQMKLYASSMHNLKQENNGQVIDDSSKAASSEQEVSSSDPIIKYSQETPVASSGDVKSEYEHAFSLLKNSEYEQAEKAFSDFISKYPKDELTGSAYYWLGESYYHRKIYNKSALNYLYSIKHFPSGSKADLSAYKLSMSFAKLNKKNEACQSFSNFLDKFKQAPDSLIKSAHAEMKKLSCQ